MIVAPPPTIAPPAAPKYAPILGEICLDPAAFARGFLGHDLWEMQEAILHSVARNPRTAVKACHASSKTFTAAEAVLWWIARFKDVIAITTSSSFTQVKRQLWGEIRGALDTSRVTFGRRENLTEIRISADNYAIGMSTNAGIRFQGFHGRILVVIDEAPGVEPEIWEAIESARAGGDVHVLALGHPTEIGGVFYDACFHSKRAGWKLFSLDAFESPNFRGTGSEPAVDLERLLEMSEAELD